MFNEAIENLCKDNNIEKLKVNLSNSYKDPEIDSVIREISGLVEKGIIFNDKNVQLFDVQIFRKRMG